MDLVKRYAEVSAILETIDFNALFPGFQRYPFALYNSREICLNGRSLPYQDSFRGNTAIFYEGENVAIWDMDLDPINDPQMLAYAIVHEMFHCHQRAQGETRYPSDLALLCYPEDQKNFTEKYNENRYLADAYELRDREKFYQFAGIREKRLKAYPDMVREEYRAETIEGMAEYIGLKALRLMNEDKFAAIVNGYLCKLREESKLLFDVRRMSYYSGAVYFLCLDRFGFAVKNAFDSEQTAYEQNPIVGNATADVYPYAFIFQDYAALLKEKKSSVEEFVAQARYVECGAYICGYDPMNMFRVDNLIYCRRFVCLRENGGMKDIQSAVVLKLADGSYDEVLGYYVK